MMTRKSKCVYKRVFFGDGDSCFDNLDEKRVSIKELIDSRTKIDIEALLFLKRFAQKRAIAQSRAFEEIIKESFVYDLSSTLGEVISSKKPQNANKMKHISIHPAYIEILKKLQTSYGCAYPRLIEAILINYKNRMNYL